MVDLTFTSELVNSMLEVTGSMQRLTDELDRISLHSESFPSQEEEDPGTSISWMHQGESASGIDDSASESQSRSSYVSSKFDSAFGSQTDSESIHSHFTSPPHYRYPLDLGGNRLDHEHHGRSSHLRSDPNKHVHRDEKSHKRRRRRKRETVHHYGDTTPSPKSTQQSYHHTNSPLSMSQSMRLPAVPQAVDRLRRGGSIRSISSNDSDASSKILSLGLSREDLREISQRPHQASPRQKQRQPSTSQRHDQSTLIQRQYQPSHLNQKQYHPVSSQERYQLSPSERQYPEVVHVQAEVHDPDSDTEVNSSEGSTPIIQSKFQSHQLVHQSAVSTSIQPTESPNEPDIVVIDTPHSKSKLQQVEEVSSKPTTMSQPHQASTYDFEPPENSNHPNTTSTNHQQTHQPSRLLPKRYVSFSTGTNKRNAPKRTASILQRLRKRSRSFKTALENRPKRRVPVKRSLSDRITYQIKKGWVHYKEDLNFISTPSFPRPVGRMIDKRAGSLHIVQLYRPPSGKYGIYISQDGPKRGIYISRFADTNAAKFYSGLMSPGDEIIRVNKCNVRDKSVDYVYDMLASLDSVVFTIIPITARPDW